MCCVLFAESFEIYLGCIDCLNRHNILSEHTVCVCVCVFVFVFVCCLQRPSEYRLLVRYPNELGVLE